MTFKPSKLAQLVVAYDAHFRKQVPIEALRILQPVDLVALIQKAIDTNTALAETGWGRASPFEFSPRGCIIDRATPTKLPSGEWLHNRVRSAAPFASWRGGVNPRSEPVALPDWDGSVR